MLAFSNPQKTSLEYEFAQHETSSDKYFFFTKNFDTWSKAMATYVTQEGRNGFAVYLEAAAKIKEKDPTSAAIVHNNSSVQCAQKVYAL